ncbi:MAG: hypothetical protein JW942_10355 [Opitutales bacterium]|nr:hypothetical protein [Opitutales bacterium]
MNFHLSQVVECCWVAVLSSRDWVLMAVMLHMYMLAKPLGVGFSAGGYALPVPFEIGRAFMGRLP